MTHPAKIGRQVQVFAIDVAKSFVGVHGQADGQCVYRVVQRSIRLGVFARTLVLDVG